MTGTVCQVADPHTARQQLPCPVTESGGFRCEVKGPHDRHYIGRHTVMHALAGNGYACTAIAPR